MTAKIFSVEDEESLVSLLEYNISKPNKTIKNKVILFFKKFFI